MAWSTYSARNEASVGTAHHLGDGRSAKTSHEYRYLGLAFLLFLIAMLAFHAKDYYVSPVYPILFAAGGIGACPDPEQLFWMAYHFHAALLVSSR